MLLDDFQENARDWLWEIDSDGRLQHVSPRLVDALGRPDEGLRGRPLVALLEEADGQHDGEQSSGATQLGLALHGGNAFRDLHVSVVVAGRRRWWALTGKRLFSDDGRSAGAAGTVTRSRSRTRPDAPRQRDALTGLANLHQFRTSLDNAAGRAFTFLSGFRRLLV
jgi:PAS domain-containing protein